jgi:hypothetical protein
MEVMTMKRHLLAGALSMALIPPAMADMSDTFRTLGETMRAGVVCHSEGLLQFHELMAGDWDVRVYSRAHPAQAKQWELAGIAKFDQDAGQFGATKNCAMAQNAALR